MINNSLEEEIPMEELVIPPLNEKLHEQLYVI